MCLVRKIKRLSEPEVGMTCQGTGSAWETGCKGEKHHLWPTPHLLPPQWGREKGNGDGSTATWRSLNVPCLVLWLSFPGVGSWALPLISLNISPVLTLDTSIHSLYYALGWRPGHLQWFKMEGLTFTFCRNRTERIYCFFDPNFTFYPRNITCYDKLHLWSMKQYLSKIIYYFLLSTLLANLHFC